MSGPSNYLSPQNSAEERIHEMNLNNNYSIPAPIDFNNFRVIPRAYDNAVCKVVPSVAFESVPKVANSPSLPPPPPYQIDQNINHGFAYAEKSRQHMPTAASMYMYNRPKPPSYPNQLMKNFGPVRQNERQVNRKPKRVRTAFTTSQITALEQEYAAKKYLDTKRRHDLAATLQLKDRAIKIWFQNRRMKEKKDRFEVAEEVIENVTTTANYLGPGAPVYQSSYYGAFNSRIAVAYTSSASQRSEVGKGTYGGYSAPGTVAPQYPPPTYDQVISQGYMPQQSVTTSPQHFELILDNSKITEGYTSSATLRSEVGDTYGKGTYGGYSAPGMVAPQYPPPTYDQVIAQRYMPQQGVTTSPQHFELIPEPAPQQPENMMANNHNGLVEIDSEDKILDLSWIDSLFIDKA